MIALAATLSLRAETTDDLTELSVEELGAISISAASKYSQPIFETPAAVSVLQSSDLLRAGFGSVAEGLRLVPGVQVANTNFDKWSIGVRGFNGVSSTKLLVMVDGRNIYSPFYAGVDWAEADMAVEDLAHIEVIRGPGATLWGVNAMNGIVSITSKSARDTQGLLVSVRDGTWEPSVAHLRYGGELGAHTWYRVYVRRSDSDDSLQAHSLSTDAAHAQVQSGFRVDGDLSDRLRFTFQGDYLSQRYVPSIFAPTVGLSLATVNRHSRGSLLGRLNWRDGNDQELTVQLYVDRARDKPGAYQGLSGGTFWLAENGDDVDLDVSHHLNVGGRHDIIWGGGARGTAFDVGHSSDVKILRSEGTDWRYNFFGQDEITLLPSRLKATIGSKFEHHDTVGWQVLPSARVVFMPERRQTWWAAVSRAVRAPSRSERGLSLPLTYVPATAVSPPVQVNLTSSESTREEDLIAYEAGWRFRPQPRLTFDLTAYVHEYTRLRNLVPVTQLQAMPLLVRQDYVEVNTMHARGHGAEAEVTWKVTDAWRLAGGFTWEELRSHEPPVTDIIAADLAEPRRMWNLRSMLTLPHDLELSAAAYGVSRYTVTQVPGYVRLDAQLTWRPRLDLEFNVGLQNAAEASHVEYQGPSSFPVTPVRRNLFGRVQWRF